MCWGYCLEPHVHTARILVLPLKTGIRNKLTRAFGNFNPQQLQSPAKLVKGRNHHTIKKLKNQEYHKG